MWCIFGFFFGLAWSITIFRCGACVYVCWLLVCLFVWICDSFFLSFSFVCLFVQCIDLHVRGRERATRQQANYDCNIYNILSTATIVAKDERLQWALPPWLHLHTSALFFLAAGLSFQATFTNLYTFVYIYIYNITSPTIGRKIVGCRFAFDLQSPSDDLIDLNKTIFKWFK